MGENLNLMQALYVTISSMAMVFLILLVISGILSLFKHIFKNENNTKKPKFIIKTIYIGGGTPSSIDELYILNVMETIKANFEIDEEEKIVVALAASIMAGDGIPNPNLHIKRITRIS